MLTRREFLYTIWNFIMNYDVFLPSILRDNNAHQPYMKFYSLLKGHPEQCRQILNVNNSLNKAAQFKAQEMIDLDYFGHTSLTGETPNELVRRYGFVTHDSYSTIGNNGESLAAGYPSIESAFQALLDSQLHESHLLGLHPFYCEQTDFGFGYAFDNDSQFRHYYVILIYRQQ